MQIDFSEKNNTFWKALRPLEKNKCGEILSSLMYQPSNSQLTLTVIKCRNLKAKDINGKSGLIIFKISCFCIKWKFYGRSNTYIIDFGPSGIQENVGLKSFS